MGPLKRFHKGDVARLSLAIGWLQRIGFGRCFWEMFGEVVGTCLGSFWMDFERRLASFSGGFDRLKHL